MSEHRVADRFEVEALIGQGGMGRVYRALDRHTGHTVALKLMRLGHSEEHETKRFEREAQVLAGLSHPGIVAHVAHGLTDTGQPFLAMEWLEGEDLAQRLARGTLTPDEALVLLRRVSEALAEAHARGVIHRDLKPTNLFLPGGQLEQVKVLDFGIARALDVGPSMTRTGVILGTPEYMPPEQVRSERAITPAADVFALGCVLYECLAGQPPFKADHPVAVLMRILLEEPRPLQEVSGVPEGLAELVHRMLAKSPPYRPRDASEVRAELEAVERSGMGEVGRGPVSRHGLGPSEQHYISIILGVMQRTTDETIRSEEAERQTQQFERLQAELVAGGCHVDRMADGSLIATLAQDARRTAVDQAVQAARCALLVKEYWPGALVALVTGRSAMRGGLPVGEVLDRAGNLLSTSSGSLHDATESVLLDEVTAGLIDAHFTAVERVRGCYTLQDARPTLDDSRPLLGKPTPCVGREQELTLLDMMLGGAIDEGARAALVTAPPGTGKSRLRHEFLRRLGTRRPDVLVLIGHGDPMSAGTSYGPLARALRKAFGVREGQRDDDSQQRLREGVQALLPGVEVPARTLVFLGELCGIPCAEQDEPMVRVARQTPDVMADQIQRAFVDLLASLCARHPVLLVLEDLHWADPLTVRLCDTALRELSEKPLAVLALARPEVRELFPRIWEGRGVQILQLGGLKRRASEQLIRAALGERTTAQTVERLAEQAAGNALFLEELIRAVAAGKGEALPETVLAMLQARLLRLAPELRRALRAASVLGETFWLGGVAALLSTAGAAIEPALASLIDAELIERQRESRITGEVEFSFRHGLMRDASYALLDEADLARAHRAAGAYLERVDPRASLVIAEHFQRGGDLARAGHYFHRAAENARATGHATLAIRSAERGLACGLPEPDQIALRGLIAEELGWLNDFRRAGELAELVLPQCTPGSTPWASAMASYITAMMLSGDLAASDQLTAHLCAVDPHPGAQAATSFTMTAAICPLVMGAQRRRSEVIAQRQGELFASSDDTLARAWYFASRTILAPLTQAGPGAGVRFGLQCEHSFASVSHGRGVCVSHLFTSYNRMLLGQYDDAARILRAAFAKSLDLGPARPYGLEALAVSLGAIGAMDEVASVLRMSLPEQGESPDMLAVREGMVRSAHAEVLRRTGDLAQAEHEARASAALLAGIDGLHLPVLGTLALTQVQRGDPTSALATATHARERIAALDYLEPRRSRVWLAQAQALHQLGQHEPARAVLRSARDTLLASAQALDEELRPGFLAVPEHASTLDLARSLLAE